MSNERLIYLALGGAGEIGMNCYVYGYGRPGKERLISFQISVGLPRDGVRDDVVSRPLAPQDVPEGTLYLCQLRGRTLPVAAAKFAQAMERSLAERFA